MASTRDEQNTAVFANRRDELSFNIQEQLQSYLQQNEGIHKELNNLENKRLELLAVAEVLQSVIDGLSGALSIATNSDLPNNNDFNGKAQSFNVSGVVKDWRYGQKG